MNNLGSYKPESDNLAKYQHVESDLLFEFSDEKTVPIVSIMIPTYKRPHLLVHALKSALEQCGSIPYEVVVVDNDANGELDINLTTFLNNYIGPINLRYYRNSENIGMFGNWNRCLQLSKCQYLTILNDDDLLNENWLSVVYNYKDLGLVKVNCKKFQLDSDINISDKQKMPKVIRKYKLIDLFCGNINPGSLGLLFDRSKCVKLGGFYEEKYPTSDYEFIYRYINEFSGVELSGELAYYRWAENESMNLATLEKFVLNDYEMRNNLYNANKFGIKWLSKMIAISYIYSLAAINPPLNVNYLLKCIECKQFDLFFYRFYRNRLLGAVARKVLFYLYEK
jgi:glycosyltransferase involved in cell wall biosynthesis